MLHRRIAIMHGWLLPLFVRVCLGILLILNGPVNAIAIGFVSSRSCCSCSCETGQKDGCKKCCGRCSKCIQSQTTVKITSHKDNSIRPTCPLCPSCPNFPGGCCVSCPCKAPLAPALMFVIPEAPVLVWLLANDDISCSESHTDEPILPPPFWQFVSINI